MFNPLHSSMTVYKVPPVIKVTTTKIWRIFVTKDSHHMLPPNRHFFLLCISKDEWNMEHRGGYWSVGEGFIIHTAVCQKALFGLKCDVIQ